MDYHLVPSEAVAQEIKAETKQHRFRLVFLSSAVSCVVQGCLEAIPNQLALIHVNVPEFVIQRIRSEPPLKCCVIEGSTPVVFFGRYEQAVVATVGSNPGSSAFLEGGSLTSDYFETYHSLGLTSLKDASDRTVKRILNRCIRYFEGGEPDLHRPWFRWQHIAVKSVGASYTEGSACHLDLVQWATLPEWGDLDRRVQSALLAKDGPFFVRMMEGCSRLRLILLNGAAVVEAFQTLSPGIIKLVDSTIRTPRIDVHFYEGNFRRSSSSVIRVIGWDKNLQQARWIDNSVRVRTLQTVRQLAKAQGF